MTGFWGKVQDVRKEICYNYGMKKEEVLKYLAKLKNKNEILIV